MFTENNKVSNESTNEACISDDCPHMPAPMWKYPTQRKAGGKKNLCRRKALTHRRSRRWLPPACPSSAWGTAPRPSSYWGRSCSSGTGSRPPRRTSWSQPSSKATATILEMNTMIKVRLNIHNLFGVNFKSSTNITSWCSFSVQIKMNETL